MASFDKQLLSIFDRIAPSFLIHAAEEVRVKLLRKYIMESFYNMYPNPSSYDRTYQLLDSVTCSKVTKIGIGVYQIEVYLNTDGVDYYDYNHHRVDPQDVFDLALEGWHGWETQTYGRFMDDAKEDLHSGITYNILDDFKTYLKGNGILTIK